MKLPIPSILYLALVASGLVTATACNDSPPGTSGGSSESGDSSTSTGPSVPPVSSSGLDSTSSDPSSSSSGNSSGSTDTGASTDASSGSTGSDSGSTSSGSTGSDSGTTGSDSDSEGSSESGTTGGGTGYCAYTCAAAADCVQPGGNPADWSCNAGFCEFVGMIPPCDPASCPIGAGFTCAFVNGFDQCVIPCTPVGNECDAFGLECSGVTDMGDSICVSPPCGGVMEGDPCFIQGFGQVGTCTGGLCTCTDDTECTAAGLACNA